MTGRSYDAILGLGSNVGDKIANIDSAIALLTAPGDVRLVERSGVYRTAPWGVADQDWFVNACVTIATQISPRDLLARCQSVENEMRRVRIEKWGPRVIDVDILSYRDDMVREPDLVIPHPYISKRAFVLVPLRDVAPDFMIDGRTIDDMLAMLDASDVVAMDETKPK